MWFINNVLKYNTQRHKLYETEDKEDDLVYSSGSEDDDISLYSVYIDGKPITTEEYVYEDAYQIMIDHVIRLMYSYTHLNCCVSFDKNDSNTIDIYGRDMFSVMCVDKKLCSLCVHTDDINQVSY